MKNIKFILLSAILIGFNACNEPEDIVELPENVVLPELTSGDADFSNFVSIGNSLTAGFTDGALFIAAQENSFPNILAEKFSLVGGGAFTQPLMNDNFGGLAVGGSRIASPRLVFGGSVPVPLESVIGPVTVTTDIALNNPTGPFNNLAVPGAASFHLIAPGYGNLANVSLGLANPYFVRMTGSTPNATVMELAVQQSPTFVSLWIGANDVLGYALGGASSAGPTPQPTFDFSIATIMSSLAGTKGVMTNIPYVTDIPYFTTIPYNTIPLDGATAGLVNGGYAPYNGGIQAAYAALAGTGLFSEEEANSRIINFTEGNNAVVIEDESLTDLGAINPAFAGLPKYRQATAEDLLILPSASFLGTTVGGNPLLINGVSVPLADNWVLVPSEKQEIKTAIDNFNVTIKGAADSAGYAFLDANALFQELSSVGYTDGDYTLTSSLVTGGALSLDGVHGTARGYALIANELMKAIDAKYGSNFEASGNLVDIGDYPTNYSPSLQ